MECVAEQKPEVFQEPVSSSQAAVHHFQPIFTAYGGSSILAPSIINSTVGNFTINFQHDQGFADELNEESCQDNTADCNTEVTDNKFAEHQQKLKVVLKKKFSYLHEGPTTSASKTLLNQIYTELYITEGGSCEVNKEHEVRQIETVSKVRATQDKVVHCNSLFEPQPGRDCPIRTVVTRGVAGIGKTVSIHKFTVDWAEGKANANIDFVFPLSFRELNFQKKKTMSLVDLLKAFFPDITEGQIFANNEIKKLFILDGLDESRLSLDFRKSEIITEITQPATVAVILTNLIRGKLLSSSLVWITSRPVASSQIPVECIDLLTEVRGFNNLQKEEYFRKKIEDRELALKVISHVKSCRSLHIMCHIPVFCWIAASVLEKKLPKKDSNDTPKTLTQMYIYFLSLFVENMKKRLPERRQSSAECVKANLLALGKLAFKELEKGHLIFYESDLKLNGIDVAQASMFSGVYTQIFNEELTLCQEKMFCFVHLSIQEFFAALYVFLTFHNDNNNVLVKKSSSSRWFPFRESSELNLYKAAIEKALQSESGHFDIFLRFLLGLSMESNQVLLKPLMTTDRTHQKTRAEVQKHIKEKIKLSQSPDRCLNLFHCLNELNDHSLVQEIQSHFVSGRLKSADLSPAQWATLVFVLLTSEEELQEFDLSRFSRSEEALLRLLPVMRTAQVAKLNACHLTMTCCEKLAIGIRSSQLRELDLSNNNLTDAGFMHLFASLRDSKLQTLRLRSCDLTEESSGSLAAIISFASCELRVLDLADNDFEDTGVKKLSSGLGSPHCKLQKLDLSFCRVTELGCTFLASALNSSGLKELDLSYNHPGESGLMLLQMLLEDPQCSLQKLGVDQCRESRIQPSPKKYFMDELTLDPNTAHKDLSLSDGNRKARRWTKLPYPDHLERFDFQRQVLCREALTGRCYWKVGWSGPVRIGVAYKQMGRKGEGQDCSLGYNDSSWALSCNKDKCWALHCGVKVDVTVAPNSTVGVFLDWSAGKLSFYSVSCGSLTFLHTFSTIFTEPVCPAFHLGWADSTVQLC
uniref:NLR family CARD domain-containing protein 3 n=1 Tax=Oryzias latipes TaxID=8090 RepID=A0A3P9IT85_ORYLA